MPSCDDIIRSFADQMASGEMVFESMDILVGETEITKPGDEFQTYEPDGRHEVTVVFWKKDKAPERLAPEVYLKDPAKERNA